MSTTPPPPPGASPPPPPPNATGIKCPNCGVRTEGLRIQERRVRTKRLGVGFWLATILTLGLWALARAVMGRKQIVRSYRCPSCSYQWTP